MSSTVPRHPGPLHHPRRREGAVDPSPEAEAGDAAGCHPEGVAGTTTMEARPLVGVAAAVEEEEGDVVAVAVGVGVAAAPPLDERA